VYSGLDYLIGLTRVIYDLSFIKTVGQNILDRMAGKYIAITSTKPPSVEMVRYVPEGILSGGVILKKHQQNRHGLRIWDLSLPLASRLDLTFVAKGRDPIRKSMSCLFSHARCHIPRKVTAILFI